MELLVDWSTPSFALAPIAPGTGPFPRRAFLEAWWDHRARPADRLMLVGDDRGLIPLVTRDDLVQFAGEADLTDYHSPLGSGVDHLLTEMIRRLPRYRFRFDSMPREAAQAVADALVANGVEAATVEHETSAVLSLPATFDDWLAAIGKKERHEVRRKRRKCSEELGPLEVFREASPRSLERFFAMHRMAPGNKGAFLTEDLEGFFIALAERAEATVDTLTAGGTPIAAAFGWATDTTYYLYNSAYDVEQRPVSPGAVLLSMIVEREIDRGATRLDFLKGDEPYKYRLGAASRPLYLLEGRLP